MDFFLFFFLIFIPLDYQLMPECAMQTHTKIITQVPRCDVKAYYLEIKPGITKNTVSRSRAGIFLIFIYLFI